MATLSDQQINNLRDQLLDAHQQGMKIVITLGPAKTGKSTLINRMIGHEMVAERRNSNGERTTKIGTVGVYHDENVHQDLTSLEVKGRVSTETPVPAIIKHDNICYLDLPEICLPNKYPRVTQVVDPVRTLARLANACNSELPVHALFLVFTEVYFSDSIMIELDKIAKQLSVLFENRRELQNIHLVINDKQVVRTVYKKHGLDNFKANLLSAISDQYIEVLSDSIEKAQDKFHEDIVKLQRNRHGWHPLLNGLVKLTQPQKRENDAKLKLTMLANQFLSRLTHTVQLSFYSTDDVEFINDLLSQRGCLSPLQQRLEPLLIRDLTNKKWLLRAFDGSNRSYDETTIAQPFKDCLNTFGFEKEISAADELRLLRELMFVLYEELPNCKMILFNPLDNGESRDNIKEVLQQGSVIPVSEFNFSAYTQYFEFLNATIDFREQLIKDIERKEELVTDVTTKQKEVARLEALVAEAKKEENEKSKTYDELVVAKKQTKKDKKADYKEKEKEYNKHSKNDKLIVVAGRKDDYSAILFWSKREYDYEFNHELQFTTDKPVLVNDSKDEEPGNWHAEDVWFRKTTTHSDTALKSNPTLAKDFYTSKEEAGNEIYYFKTIFKSATRTAGTLNVNLYAQKRHTYAGRTKTEQAEEAMNEAKVAWDKEKIELGDYKTKEGAIKNLPTKEQDLADTEQELKEVKTSLQENKAQALMLCFLFESIKGLGEDEDAQAFVQMCKQFYDIETIDLDTIAVEHRLDTSGRPIVIGADATPATVNTSVSATATRTTSATSYQSPSATVRRTPTVATPPPAQTSLDASRFSTSSTGSGAEVDFDLMI